MEGTECSNVGVAINFNPEREMIRVVLTMHDGEGETVGWVMLPSNKAAEDRRRLDEPVDGSGRRSTSLPPRRWMTDRPSSPTSSSACSHR